MSNKVAYWLDLCDDDLITAKWLLEGGRLLHCGYLPSNCGKIIKIGYRG